MKSPKRLTTAGRVVVFLLCLALLGGIGFVGYKFIGNSENKATQANSDSNPVIVNESASSSSTPSKAQSVSSVSGDWEDDTINLSLDEWIGWKPIIDANGGLKTQPGSIFDSLGLKVKLYVINDGTESSNALIKGELNAAGYTTNRTAFLSSKFNDANIDVVMPVFTNYSSGGDGIISKSGINKAEDFIGKKIGVPRFSEAQTLIAWFVNKSDMSDSQKKEILDNMVLFGDASEAGEAFFAGQIDVAATWQPYLSYASSDSNSQIMFDTRVSKSLIMDGILFRKDFAEKYPDTVSKFIEGIFTAQAKYTEEFTALRSVMPMFAELTDEEIVEMCADAEQMGYSENKKVLEVTAPKVYSDMCDIWVSLGESSDKSIVDSLFDDSYLSKLSDKYANEVVVEDKPVIDMTKATDEERNEVIDYPSLISKSVTIEFVPDTAKFINPNSAYDMLDTFVDIANILDGSIIQIEGNINSRNTTDAGTQLSLERANTVARYLVSRGISEARIITIGNGNTKMLADPSSDDAGLNRRTDITFKMIEE